MACLRSAEEGEKRLRKRELSLWSWAQGWGGSDACSGLYGGGGGSQGEGKEALLFPNYQLDFPF